MCVVYALLIVCTKLQVGNQRVSVCECVFMLVFPAAVELLASQSIQLHSYPPPTEQPTASLGHTHTHTRTHTFEGTPHTEEKARVHKEDFQLHTGSTDTHTHTHKHTHSHTG